MSNVAFGKAVLESEGIRNATAVTDGHVTGYDKSSGFASFPWPGQLTVDLERIYSLYAIRFLLWDGRGSGGRRDARRYRYRLLTSKDKESWTLQYETDKSGSNGWQVFEAREPIRARYIRIEGKHNTANNSFHIVQIEAYDADPPPIDEVELSKVIPPGSSRRSTRSDRMIQPQFGSPLHAGILLDQYQLKRFISQGQSAQVWEAEVVQVPSGAKGLGVGEKVAIKVYDLQERGGVQTIRTQREFLVARDLKHPNLVEVCMLSNQIGPIHLKAKRQFLI